MLAPMRRALVLTAVLLMAGLLPSGVSAATVAYRTDAELIAMSQRIVHGRVLGHRFERPGGINAAIYTVTTLAVLEDFTGVPGDTVEVWELGGVSDGEIMFVGGEVKYETGHRGARVSRARSLRLSQCGDGLLQIRHRSRGCADWRG